MINSLSFYRSILESFSEGLVITNNTSQIVFVNDKLCEMFEYDKNDLLDQFIEILIPKEIFLIIHRRLRFTVKSI